MKPKFGVIGVGKWGKNHVRVYKELGFELVGIADVSEDAKNVAAEFSVKLFPDYRQLLPHVDAVSVVVPTHMHYGVVKECLLSGKHVLVEKPMTLDSSQARELVDIAKKKKLVLMVGYLFRFNASVLELRKRIKSAGKINYITARYVHSNKPPRKDCGVIFNFATHLVDILNFIIDQKPLKVSCRKVCHISSEREDGAIIILDYGSFFASLEVSWLHPQKKRDMWIIGSDEKIYADFLEQMLVVHPIRITGESIERGPVENVEIRKNEPLKEEIKSFSERIISGSFRDGEVEVLITKVCEKCIESANKGCEVQLKL